MKALRLYDRRGLLRPVLVDVTSGYRYHDPDQVEIVRSIQLMRSLHMPLADIATLLSTDNPAEVERCLERYRQRVKSQLEEYERVLERLPTVDEWCRSTRKDRRMDLEGTTYRCSFCGKENQEVRRMIAGPNGAFICNQCVTKCNDIIATEEAKATGTGT